MRSAAVLLLAASLLLLPGCGGGSDRAENPPPPNVPPPAPGNGAGLTDPVVVNVGAGATVAGINITVPGPAGSPAPNAELLGATPLDAAGSAFNTGATVRRGSTMRVIIFGNGLTADMRASVSGTGVTVSNVRGITSTSGKPGIAFDAAIAGDAPLGARTVILVSSRNDVTTFTGGLEVVP